MDPRQTLIDAQTHVNNGHQVEALEALADYWRWRDRGGFEPTADRDAAPMLTDSGDDTARAIARQLGN